MCSSFRNGAEKHLKLVIRIDYSVTSWKTFFRSQVLPAFL